MKKQALRSSEPGAQLQFFLSSCGTKRVADQRKRSSVSVSSRTGLAPSHVVGAGAPPKREEAGEWTSESVKGLLQCARLRKGTGKRDNCYKEKTERSLLKIT